MSGQPRGTFCTLVLSEWKRGETAPFLQDYCIKQQDTHFPHRCAKPQHADRNGPKDNEGKINAI